MSRAPHLARIFTPTYAARINAQIVHPAKSIVVKPNELESALLRPLHTWTYAPEKPPAALAATLAYGLIKGHPFLDGNKRTAFFLANEYIRAHGLPGLADDGKVGEAPEQVVNVVESHVGVADGSLDLDSFTGR